MFEGLSRLSQMWTDLWNDGKHSRVPVDLVYGIPGVSVEVPYKSVEQIRKECSGTKSPKSGFLARREARKAAQVVKPFFYLSKSTVFRRRVGRIIYGEEGKDIFL